MGADYSFAAWADVWYENHKDNVKPTTQENYRYTLKILKDHFDNAKYLINGIIYEPVHVHYKTISGIVPLNLIAIKTTESFLGATVEFV